MRRYLVLITVGILLSSCSQKRDEQFSQGQGQDLKKVVDYNNKWYKLKTGASIGSSPATVALNIDVNAPGYELYSFPLVSTTTDEKLLGEVAFRGKPNTEYDLLYHLDDNYFKIYKVAKKELIPTDEHAYAETVEGVPADKIAVPLVGYPIKGFFKIENQTNSYNEESHILVAINRTGYHADGMVNIDFLSRTVFHGEENKDVFPTKFFAGKWFYVNTVVRTRELNNNEESGDDDDLGLIEGSRLESTRVNFNLDNENYVEVRSTAIPKAMLSDVASQPFLLKIRTKWLDPEVESVGRSRGLKGAQRNRLNWRDRPYIALDFNDLSASKALEEALGARKQVSDIVVEDGYLGVTLYYPEKGIKIVHSFMRIDDRIPYTPKSIPLADTQLFGFFPAGIKPEQYQLEWRTSDHDKQRLITRFNPNLPNVTFYFVQGTPEIFKDWGKQIVKNWNDAFAAIGKPNWVVLNTDKEVALGDPRYNKLNFVWSESDSMHAPYGYGPAFWDDVTGEIISGTANIYASQMFFAILGDVRSYVLRKAHKENESLAERWMQPVANAVAVSGSIDDPKGWIASMADKNANPEVSAVRARSLIPEFKSMAELDIGDVRKSFGKIEAALNMAVTAGSRTTSNQVPKAAFFNEVVGKYFGVTSKPETDPAKAALKKKLKNVSACSANISTPVALHKIEELCPEIVSYAQGLGKGNDPASNEVEMFRACAQKLLVITATGAGSHEVGHVFGLTHNFKGSVDAPNFYTKEETGTPEQIRMSSIMEYPEQAQYWMRDRVGKYDIAAIRYAYKDEVESEDGKIVKMLPNMSIEQSVPNHKKYGFCDDIMQRDGNDPFCRAWDDGITLKEITDNHIASYFMNLALSRHRYDRAYFNPNNSLQGRIMELEQLLNIYNHYRYELSKIVLNETPYFQTITPDNYKAQFLDKLDAAIADEKQRNGSDYSTLEDLRKSARSIEQFLLEIAFLPDHYCKIKSEDKSVPLELMPFSQLREEISGNLGVKATSCRDEVVTKYLSATGRRVFGGDAGEIGYDVANYSYDTNDQKLFNREAPFDVAGTEVDRRIAISILSIRTLPSIKAALKDFYPIVLDDPMIRKEFQLKLWSRVILGLTTEGLPPNINDFKSNVENENVEPLNESLLKTLGHVKKKKKSGLAGVLEEPEHNDILDLLAQYEKTKKVLYKEYRTEENIIDQAMWSMTRGFIVPGSIDETKNRLVPSRFYHTNDEQTLQSLRGNPDFVSMPFDLTGTTVYASFSRNPMSAALLESYIKSDRQRHMADMGQDKIRKMLFTPVDQLHEGAITPEGVLESVNTFAGVVENNKRWIEKDLAGSLQRVMQVVGQGGEAFNQALQAFRAKLPKDEAAAEEQFKAMFETRIDDKAAIAKLSPEGQKIIAATANLYAVLPNVLALEPEFASFFANFEFFKAAHYHLRGEMNKQIDLMTNLIIRPSGD